MMTAERSDRAVLGVVGVYAVVVAGIWGAADILIDALALPDVILSILVVSSVAGLPIVVVGAWYRGRRAGRAAVAEPGPVDATAPTLHRARSSNSRMRRPVRIAAWGVVGVFALWGATSAALVVVSQAREARLAQLESRLVRLADSQQYDSAFAAAAGALPEDGAFAKLWDSFSTRLDRIDSEPPGALVARARYADPGAQWEPLGRTPIVDIRVPRGISRYRFDMNGHESIELVTTPPARGEITVPLPPAGSVPDGMVFVPPGTASIPNYASATMDVAAYLIDRHEVTNAQFAEFVRTGGYANATFWTDTLELDGRDIAWPDAVQRFTDRTGRPGPATWIAGDYPDGMDDYPVQGVSWFEARAYARFVGKDLPSAFHWHRAALVNLSSYVIPVSNFNSSGPVAVGTMHGVAGWGTKDMAGNVREWVLNASGSERFILGGAWNDNTYLFPLAYAANPWDRSEKNGFRLVRYLDDADVVEAGRPLDLPYRDYTAERPVSDDVFAGFAASYEYDRVPVNATTAAADTTEDWIVERVTFDAAYNNDTVVADLYLPRVGTPPFQAVVYMPGSGAVTTGQVLNDVREAFPLDFIVKTGRAVLLPAYDGTYDRRNENLTTTRASPTYRHAEHTAHWVKDVRRSVDFLESRNDLDPDRIAYFGTSWGGRVGAIVLAMEPRFKVAVLYLGGFRPEHATPVADDINYVPRVKSPVLMINGRDDHLRPLEKSQRPFFELLGTDPQHKVHRVFPGGHYVPRSDLIRESLDWLDGYLGRAGRESS